MAARGSARPAAGDTTKLTEIVTGLGMLGGGHPLTTLPVRPGELRNVDDDTWASVVDAWREPSLRPLVDAAFENGRYFLEATEALRGRRPRVVEWTGRHRFPGDEVVPVDLRVDHVFLVSCKYLSRITMNASPSYLFERLLTGGQGVRGTDWYRHVAPGEYDRLWAASLRWLAREHPTVAVRADTADMARDERKAIGALLREGRGWPAELLGDYQDLCDAVSERSAQRWSDALSTLRAGSDEAMLWRLLRIGSAPYFVLGVGHGAAAEPLRLRVGSPWDMRQHFRLERWQIAPRHGGQPMVEWQATFRRRDDDRIVGIHGHIEIRWSHGRFSGPPEAKVYLDTPFPEVPGYWPI